MNSTAMQSAHFEIKAAMGFPQPSENDLFITAHSMLEDGEGITINEIIDVVASVSKLSPRLLKSGQRHRPIYEARHVVYALSRTLTNKSTTQIGRALGNRDHSTVMHGHEIVVTNYDRFKKTIEATCIGLGVSVPRLLKAEVLK